MNYWVEHEAEILRAILLMPPFDNVKNEEGELEATTEGWNANAVFQGILLGLGVPYSAAELVGSSYVQLVTGEIAKDFLPASMHDLKPNVFEPASAGLQ